MDAISYLYKVKLKGYFRSLKNKPSNLIALLITIALLLFSIFSARETALYSSWSEENLSITEIKQKADALVVCVAWFLLASTFLAETYMSTKRGFAEFSLADSQFMMTSPLRPQTVLLYGLLNNISHSLMSIFFFIYIAPALKSRGVNSGQIFGFILTTIFLIICLLAFVQMLYEICVRHTKVKYLLRSLVILCAVAIIGGLLYIFILAGKDIQDLVKLLTENVWLKNIPLIGWGADIFVNIYRGKFTAIIWPIVGLIIVTILSLVYSYHVELDYYEEAIVRADRQYELKHTARKNKNDYNVNAKRKVRSVGLGKGEGESTFFFLHLLEQKRVKPHVVSFRTFLFTLVAAVLSYIYLKGIWGSADNLLLLYICVVSFFTMEFMPRNPLFADFYQPYFYITPGSNVKKIACAFMPPIVFNLIDFLPGLVILLFSLKLNFASFLLGLLLCLAISLIYMAGQFIVFCILGKTEGILANLLYMPIYIFFFAIVVLPVVFLVNDFFELQKFYLYYYLIVFLLAVINFAIALILGNWRMKKGILSEVEE